jgi:hypothetical protein
MEFAESLVSDVCLVYLILSHVRVTIDGIWIGNWI